MKKFEYSLLALTIALGVSFLQQGSKASTSPETGTRSSQIVESRETLDSWMPDKGLQQDILAYLKKTSQLPKDATLEDITKEVANNNRYINIDITNPVSSLQGLEFFNGMFSIGYLTFRNTKVLFPDLSNLNLNNSYRQLATQYDNNGFNDLSQTLNQIKQQLSTREDLGKLHVVYLGFTHQHFTDISPWYGFSQQYSNLSLYQNGFWGFNNNTAFAEAQLEENGDIVLKNPLYIFDDQGNRISLTDGITATNNGSYDQGKNEIIWHNADPNTKLEVNWKKIMSDSSPYNKQPNKDINFNGQLTINVLGRPVTVNYLDESHNKIAESKIITGYFGDNYKTEQVDVPGYTFISVDGEKVGKIGAKNVIVNYYYKKESTPTVPTTPTTPTTPTVPTTPTTPTAPTTPTTPTAPTTRPDQVSDSDIPNYVVAKGQAVYAVNTIGLYKKGDFSKRNRIKYYKRAVRINRPEFVVKGYKRDKSGKLRYRVQQYSPYAKRYIKGTSGYITSSVKYVIPAYYATLPANKKIKIINPNGINSYRKLHSPEKSGILKRDKY
ncbi:MucBP domain-containing protein [Lentilactobacillus hilgardii]|uniref:MucBP domain protein n=1 Tax=Lentilactobacillus hilgardii (strain ATCC 8290 / DSM 20176 / CCUG 30140 / JCM 1155 / KCTC 3500 / NBRC 15886 / NCIMB 8040 / NRRL B-1843 / 9) TaxID=1423757 RepID=C0XL49_LENH9|nr:MucBP domain-containing protein [Lentilactobacillus hilgardii]EEI23794.1 MucBP domain protein [Lentilactobacillus hilgardii DSM 20176 = ATCC 8290]TDG86037.1 hypothetical protein C5L34_002198 [Lentilactobacillus hilgardii]